MTGASRFYNAIRDVAGLRQSELIAYFVYYLTVEAGASCATPAEINRCFLECDLQPPANTSARLSQYASGSSRRFLKVSGGYRLHRAYREEIARRLGNLPVAFQTSETLRRLETKFTEEHEKAFLAELINCFEVGANRASIVLCWILAIDHLYDYVTAHHLSG
jgi:hypothetical protein